MNAILDCLVIVGSGFCAPSARSTRTSNERPQNRHAPMLRSLDLCGLIMKGDGTRTECLRAQEFQTQGFEVLEDTGSSSIKERINNQANLVDEVVSQHRLRELAHAV